MLYLVTKKKELFENNIYRIISIEESISLLNTANRLQFDTETSGRCPHLCNLLCMQFGNEELDFQIVIDCLTISPVEYKSILESKLLIGQNLKFDLQFLYKYSIIPKRIYDTMIAEQTLYLGYPPEVKSYSLKSLCKFYLNIDIDKTTRGEIIWRGLDSKVIQYAADDVKYLEQIMQKQIVNMKEKDCIKAVFLECNVVPCMAYIEWCGIKLDETKWKEKMKKDKTELDKALEDLNSTIIKRNYTKYLTVNRQGSLFDGFDLTPKVNINWASSKQVIPFFKELGFNTIIKDKKTGENKDSVLEKTLSIQKGIDDEILTLYFNYKAAEKKVSSFGQGHLNAINPITGRIHTNYWQLGAKSGRMSCGGGYNSDVAKFKKLPEKEVPNPNMQQLPHDKETRACFVAEKGNLFCSCDYAAEEARLGAMVYNEKTLIDEFLYGSGDSHAAYAKAAFPEELKDIPTKDVKKLRPDLRTKVKSLEFALQFGSDGSAAAPALGVSVEEARKFAANLLSNMKGLQEFKKTSSKLVKQNGYVIAMKQTGHKVFWYDHNEWLKRQQSFTPEFWEEYKRCHKGTGDSVENLVKYHFKAGSYWERMALNVPTQGCGSVILKDFLIDWFNWVVSNGYFGKILAVNATHDEFNSEFPEELKDTYPKLVAKMMEESAYKYFKQIPIPAEPEVDTCWRH